MPNYLIIKIGAIGDVIMALPMIASIREQHKAARICWVVGKSALCIVERFGVDELIVVDEKELLSGNILRKLWALFKIWKILLFRRFDFVLIGYHNWRYRLIPLVVLSKVTRWFEKGARDIPIPGRHFSDEYVRLATNNELKKVIRKDLLMNIDSKCLVKKDNLRNIALAPGGAKNILSDDVQRRWPVSHYVFLAEILIKEGYRVFITGGLSDKWVEPYFTGLDVENFIGKTDLLELADLYSQMDVVVTHDSGPMHIAGLVHANLIALFGPTNPYEKIPQNDNARFVWLGRDYSCCPCYDGKTYAVCEDNLCLKAISPFRIVEEIQDLLKDG